MNIFSKIITHDGRISPLWEHAFTMTCLPSTMVAVLSHRIGFMPIYKPLLPILAFPLCVVLCASIGYFTYREDVLANREAAETGYVSQRVPRNIIVNCVLWTALAVWLIYRDFFI